ncbi:hypothetical protein C9413_18340 [Rhizobium sp. SEMIA 4085]|uniref:ATP-dependent DNA ligase domain-containing protein n=1 Tax=Rhizobium gallicum bv. gallicum R602sp TaxID=1041138 RepID=A0A0B4X018_9HYPH|nr:MULTISPECIES: hypothetical protein [Rhizobium]AJD41289.1 ATP-dependent DNA ligase domain-containing protein [Rhizobium gallicum bv. gallicum R602sp]NNH31386.1 hypothetical protein [Rhizobium sp. SEMIA 4085]
MTRAPQKPKKSLLAKDVASVRTRATKPRDPTQPNRSLDPMPNHIDLCRTLFKHQAAEVRAAVYEINWGGHDWTHCFRAIEQAAKQLGVAWVLDGEAVVLDEQGGPISDCCSNRSAP